jgi:GT2 family glycosyltransferase
VQLSIVIPTRNRDDALGRCLTLLRPQLDETAEVIVTDDGRSPRTEEMLRSQFPFARWIPGAQRGPAANRNHGAKETTGDFIIFLDDDVEPTAELVSSYRTSIREDVNVYEGRTTCRAGLNSPLDLAPMNETGGCLWSCNMMIRRSTWQSIGGFDEDFPHAHLEDVVFRERIRTMGERPLFVPGATVDHPPRRLPPARELAMRHEGYFIYEYKYLDRAPSMSRFFSHLVRHRVNTVLQHRLSADSIAVLGGVCVESFHVLTHWRAWNRRWVATKGTGVSLREPWDPAGMVDAPPRG